MGYFYYYGFVFSVLSQVFAKAQNLQEENDLTV
jgi:hypothetical protein